MSMITRTPPRPGAIFDHGPESPDEASMGPTVDFRERTRAEIFETEAFRYRIGNEFRDQRGDLPMATIAKYSDAT